VAWNPAVDIGGDPGPVRVGATDVASTSACGRFLALKTRRAVKQVDGWSRLFPPDGQSEPFPLGDVLDLVLSAHSLEFPSYAEFHAWLRQRLDARRTPRLMRPYIEHAVENVLDAHESIEGEVGRLRLLVKDPHVGPQDRRLWVWGPLYATDDGTREIRRLRLGSAHEQADEDDERWAATAAYVAATFPSAQAAVRVRVVEVGPLDGGVAVLFDGTNEEAVAGFTGPLRERAARLVDADHVVPCRSCGECKTAGSCRELIRVDNVLGQSQRGLRSRSISPSGLQTYRTCPAQWLLADWLHLPKERADSEEAARGGYVHRWLESAHQRRTRCMPDDLPEPGGDLGLAAGLLDPDDYLIAYPYLKQHLAMCPLGADEATVVAVEDPLHGYDHIAEVVIVMKPDLLFKVGERLVIREVKTSGQTYAGGRDDAWNKHLQVPFALTLLASGLAAAYGCTTSSVEVELLTESTGELWAWDNDDPAVAAVAAGDVRRAAQEWHLDSTWQTNPGPHCGWCPVSQWCPDRDVFVNRQSGTTADASAVVSDNADDEPPF